MKFEIFYFYVITFESDLEWGCTKTVVLCVQTDLTAKVSSTHPNLGHKPVHVISKEKRRIYDKLGFYIIKMTY